MMGERHALMGAAGWVALEPITRLPVGALAAGTAVAACSALWPDFDAVGSRAARSLGPLTKLTAYGVRRASGGHRQGTHSIFGLGVAAAIVTAPAVYFGWPWWIVAAVATGYAIHLLGDCMTIAGCPLLWFPRRPDLKSRSFWVLPRLLRVRTGNGFGEWLASSVFVALAAGALIAGVIR